MVASKLSPAFRATLAASFGFLLLGFVPPAAAHVNPEIYSTLADGTGSFRPINVYWAEVDGVRVDEVSLEGHVDSLVFQVKAPQRAIFFDGALYTVKDHFVMITDFDGRLAISAANEGNVKFGPFSTGDPAGASTLTICPTSGDCPPTRRPADIPDQECDMRDELTGEPINCADAPSGDLRGVWFEPTVGRPDFYDIVIRVGDLSEPPKFRPGRNVFSWDVFFTAKGQDFKAVVWRIQLPVGAVKNALLDVQGVAEKDPPAADVGTAELSFSVAFNEITLTLPRAWSVTTPTGERLRFEIGPGTELTNLRAIALDGMSPGNGCNPCTIIDRASSSNTSIGFGAAASSEDPILDPLVDEWLPPEAPVRHVCFQAPDTPVICS